MPQSETVANLMGQFYMQTMSIVGPTTASAFYKYAHYKTTKNPAMHSCTGAVNGAAACTDTTGAATNDPNVGCTRDCL